MIKNTLEQILLGFLLVLTAGAVWADDAAQLVAKADKAYAEFDNESALEAYQEAYKLVPNNSVVLMKVTRGLIDVGEDLNNEKSADYFQKAVNHAEKLISVTPKDAQAYYLLAIACGNLSKSKGKWEQAELSKRVEKNSLEAIKLNPKFSRPYCALAVLYSELADLDAFSSGMAKTFVSGFPKASFAQAETYFNKAIEVWPENLYAHYYAGINYIRMKKPEKAKTMFTKLQSLPTVDHQDDKLKKLAKERIQELQVNE